MNDEQYSTFYLDKNKAVKIFEDRSLFPGAGTPDPSNIICIAASKEWAEKIAAALAAQYAVCTVCTDNNGNELEDI